MHGVQSHLLHEQGRVNHQLIITLHEAARYASSHHVLRTVCALQKTRIHTVQ